MSWVPFLRCRVERQGLGWAARAGPPPLAALSAGFRLPPPAPAFLPLRAHHVFYFKITGLTTARGCVRPPRPLHAEEGARAPASRRRVTTTTSLLSAILLEGRSQTLKSTAARSDVTLAGETRRHAVSRCPRGKGGSPRGCVTTWCARGWVLPESHAGGPSYLLRSFLLPRAVARRHRTLSELPWDAWQATHATLCPFPTYPNLSRQTRTVCCRTRARPRRKRARRAGAHQPQVRHPRNPRSP